MAKNSIFMVVENAFPSDPRVRKEAFSLRERFDITVLCIKRPAQKWRDNVNGISVFRIPPAPSLPFSFATYVFQYIYITSVALVFFMTTFPFKRYRVIHVHNPPDTLFVIGLIGKLFGVKFIFDHHDLSPELFDVRYQGRLPFIKKILLLLEGLSCKLADVIISTNASYKKIVVDRHNLDPGDIHIVRNNPQLEEFSGERTLSRESNGKVIAYVGAINPQDGLENMIEIIYRLIHVEKRHDLSFKVIGDGDSLPHIRKLSSSKGLDDHIEFFGAVSDRKFITDCLLSADIGIEPALDLPLNRYSTFIKIMEYMAAGLPVVAFDLLETRFTLDGSGLLVPSGDVDAFSAAIIKLLNDPDLREELGQNGKKRIQNRLNWSIAAKNLDSAYESIGLSF